eukprot:1593236-Rhodomonas_salina.1
MHSLCYVQYYFRKHSELASHAHVALTKRHVAYIAFANFHGQHAKSDAQHAKSHAPYPKSDAHFEI